MRPVSVRIPVNLEHLQASGIFLLRHAYKTGTPGSTRIAVSICSSTAALYFSSSQDRFQFLPAAHIVLHLFTYGGLDNDKSVPKPGSDTTPVAKVGFVTAVVGIGCGVGYYK